MTKLFILIVFLLFSSYGFGFEYQSRLNLKTNIYALPIGIASLFISLQFFYYPIQYFNLSSDWVHLVSTIVFLLGMLLAIKHFKHFKELFDLKFMMWISIYLFVFWIVLYNSSISLPFSDSQMYLNYIAQNKDTSNVNLFHLWTGIKGQEFDTIYLFQGYYHFAGFISKFIEWLAVYLKIGQPLSIIVTTVYGLGTLYAIVFGVTIYHFVESFKLKSKLNAYILLFIGLFYFGFYYYRVAFAFYGNTWRTLFVTLVFFELFISNDQDEKAHLILAGLFIAAGIFTSASTLFIAFALLYGYSVYRLIEKKSMTIQSIFGLIFPMVIYAMIMIAKDGRSFFIPLLMFVLSAYGSIYHDKFKRFWLELEQFLSKYTFFLFIIVIPIFAFIVSLWIMKNQPDYLYGFSHALQNHQNYDMVQDYSFRYSDLNNILMNLFRFGGLALLWIRLQKYSRSKMSLWITLSVALLFLTPFTTPFVSKMLASNVYYRAFDAIFNPFTELLYIAVLLEWASSKLRFLLIGVLIFVVFNVHYLSMIVKDVNHGYGFYIVEGQSVMPIEKIPYSEYKVIQALKENIQEAKFKTNQLTVISHADGLRTFVPEAYQIFTARAYWYEWDRVDEVFYYAARRYYPWEQKLYPTVFETGCMYLLDFKVDYAIIDTYNNKEFYQNALTCSEELYFDEGFSLLKIK
jgi:hypothetical protein